jgi:hypothetical protein
MKLIDKDALSMELTNEVLDAYAKADFRFAHALNVFQGLIDKAPTVEERKHRHWEGGGAYYCSNCNVYAATDVFGGGLDITEQHYCYNCGANLSGANLRSAYLRDADLDKTYYQVVRIGSRRGTTTYCVDDDNVLCGCWNNYKGGTLEEFKTRVESVYGREGNNPNEQYYDEYMAAITFFAAMKEMK